MAVQDLLANAMSVCHSHSTDDDAGSVRGRRVEEQLDHPTLNALRAQARKDAERVHALKTARKPGKKGQSKRTISNIRSAEISREAKTLLIKLMEDRIEQEEQKWCDVLSQMFDVTRDNITLQRKIDARNAARKRPRSEALPSLLPVEMDGLEGAAFAEWNDEEVAVADTPVAHLAGCWCARTEVDEGARAVSAWRRERPSRPVHSKSSASPVTVFRTALSCSPASRAPKARAPSPRSVRL
eukprot:TRINITY_DN36_c0_g1_i1.p1 TRINITY_DN36_c0_g1~~TRINITY_DN36_c0_g1_i1.p1  ORF type:complete len:241 (+),score=48.12 TRINITY_DN36_c0_g1_i1:547-1269(+)